MSSGMRKRLGTCLISWMLSIPIRHGMTDRVAWHFDKGMFSMKSRYQLGVRLHDNKLGSDASSLQKNLPYGTLHGNVYDLVCGD
jgi:hypothetical protein